MKLNKTIPDYNKVKEIGRGAFGKIYLIELTNSKERYALKKISLKVS